MKKLIIFLLSIAFIQTEYVSNFNLQNFYFEYRNKKYTANMINNPTSKEIVNQLPLENLIVTEGLLISIPLKTYVYIDTENLAPILIKGNILSDGKNLLIYYGSNQIIPNPSNNYLLIGNLNDVDDLKDSIDLNPSFHLTFRILCESSIIRNENIIISIDNPSFKLFNKNSLNFEEVPKLYFGSNNEPLYSNCNISKEMPYEINCYYNIDEIEKYHSLYPGENDVFEIIPGCSHKINTSLSILFSFSGERIIKKDIENCIEYYANYTCSKCKGKKYKASKDGKECEYSSFFLFIVIGIPIIDVALIIFMILACVNFKCECEPATILFFIFFAVFVIVNTFSFLSFFLVI